MYSKDMYQTLINQIREKCLINNEEERKINRFVLEKFQAELKSSEISPLRSQPNDWKLLSDCLIFIVNPKKVHWIRTLAYKAYIYIEHQIIYKILVSLT